jgi:hypothetical protein
MKTTIRELFDQILLLKSTSGSRFLIQKLQQKVDEIKRQASDKQATNKTA